MTATTAANRLPAICSAHHLRRCGRQAVASSVDVAKRFDRSHFHVLRDIAKLRTDHPILDGRDWFLPTIYRSRQRHEMPAYDMTRSGFVLLVMGWTGPQALAFKIAYIEAFDAMEEALLFGAPGAPPLPWKRLAPLLEAALGPTYDAARSAGDRLKEQELVAHVVDDMLTEHIERVRPALLKFVHDQVLGPFQRRHNAALKRDDPDRPELPLGITVRRDGFDCVVPLASASREETGGYLRRQVRTAEGLRNVARGIFRRCRAVLGHHNTTRPDEAFSAAELEEISPELSIE